MALPAMFLRLPAFDSARLRSAFAARKPRNPLLRVTLGLVGLALLALLLVFGAIVGAVMLAVGVLYRLWTRPGKPIAGRVRRDRRIVDGEYTVLGKTA